jgi:ABC-type bacteriocin/lantibiotic exporter with double-glycine peptidase domain
MSKRTWWLFARLFGRSRGTLVAAGLLSVAQVIVLAPTAFLVGHAFDKLVPAGDVKGLFLTAGAILATYLASAGLALLTRHLVLKAAKGAITELRSQLLERIYALPRAYFDRTSVGRLHSIVVQDSERVDVMANMLVGVLLPSYTVALGLCVILVVLNAPLFALLLTVVPVLMLLGRWLGKKVRAHTRRWQAAFDVFSTQTQLTLRAITLAKVQGAERTELAKRRAEQEALGQAGREMGYAQGAYYIAQNVVTASAGVLVLAFGGRAVALHQMTMGHLLSFYAILALLLKQVTLSLQAMPRVHSGYESIARLETILDAQDREPYAGSRRLEFGGGLDVEDISFSYGDEPLLTNLTLRVDPGEHAAIFGPNGAGKSTLVSLLLGLYRPQRGRVLADGVPYDALDVRELRRSIGVVLQDAVIFPGTIAENIAYGRPDATFDDIRRAARWATADEFIEQLPRGYETETGDEGGLVSGGQRQRIAIARALVAHPSVLIFDEPTTHLDDASIRTLLANLCDFPGAPTVLLISHDSEVANYVDAVHYLRDGRIVRTERFESRVVDAAVRAAGSS